MEVSLYELLWFTIIGSLELRGLRTRFRYQQEIRNGAYRLSLGDWNRTEIRLESKSNHLLIDFFDPKSSSESKFSDEIDSSSSEVHRKARKRSKEMENKSDLLEFNQKRLKKSNRIYFDFFHILIDFFIFKLTYKSSFLIF